MDHIFLQLKRACARVTKVASAEAQSRAGVFGAQAQALLVIASFEKCKIKDIADQLELGKANLTTLVSRLKSEKLISTQPDPKDRRSTLLVLTNKGKSALADVEILIDAMNAELLEGFGAEDTATIQRFLLQASKLQLKQKD